MTPEQEQTRTQTQQDEAKYRKWRTRAVQSWALVGICILIGIAIYVCNIIWQAVAVVIVTALAVFLLHGFVNAIERGGLPRLAAVAIAVLIVSAIVLGCVIAFIPMLVQQLASFVSHLPGYSNQLQDFISQHSSILGENSDERISAALASFTSWVQQQAGTIASTMANGVIGITIGVGNGIVIGFIALVCTFWILLDLPKITVEIRSLFDKKHQGDIDIIGDAFGNAIYGWAKSTLVCAVLTGVVSGLAFWLMGIPYAAVLGFIAGILYLVPYIGPMITCALVFVIALFVSLPIAIGSIVVNVIVNNVIGNIVSPRLMKTSVNVHPVLILLAILIGGAVGGIAGMLLSIPIVAALHGLFVTYYEARTGRQIATEDGALFQKPHEHKLPKLK